MRGRYHSLTYQRFISPDPIGFAGGDPNLYAYVHNDPVDFTDRFGLGPSGFGGGGTAAAAAIDAALRGAAGGASAEGGGPGAGDTGEPGAGTGFASAGLAFSSGGGLGGLSPVGGTFGGGGAGFGGVVLVQTRRSAPGGPAFIPNGIGGVGGAPSAIQFVQFGITPRPSGGGITSPEQFGLLVLKIAGYTIVGGAIGGWAGIYIGGRYFGPEAVLPGLTIGFVAGAIVGGAYLYMTDPAFQ